MLQLMKYLKTSLETTDDGRDEDIQQPQIYAKDSLDRFGDDLCALIVSYLRVDDRFRLECVSKQFQRTVFGSVVDINLSDRFVYLLLKEKRCDTQLLATITIKCPNIETIDCREITLIYEEHIPEVLTTFRDNCRHLRDIYCNLWIGCARMRSLVPLVTRIGHIYSSSYIHVINHCHRLSELRINSFDRVFRNGYLLAKNLSKCELKDISDHDLYKLSVFVTHNECLKSFEVTIVSLSTTEALTQMCGQLSRLTQLRELVFGLQLNVGHELVINSCLRTIGLNCKQLKRLSVSVFTTSTELIVQTLDSLRFYPQLKRLDLKFVNVLLDPLRHCERLTHLELDLLGVNVNLLTNVFHNCTRLQHLSIGSNYMTRERLDPFPRLPALQTLVIESWRESDLSDNDYSDLFSSSPRLKNIEIRVNNEKKFYSK